MNIEQLNKANKEITELKAELAEHDDQITNIEIVNQEILAVADAKFNRLVDQNNGLKAMTIELKSCLEFCIPHAEFALQGQMFSKGMAASRDALNKTPKQCLADVKADAVKTYVDSFDGNCTVMVYKSWIKKDGAHYANKLREKTK